MSRKSVVLAAFILGLALCPAISALSQCKNQITLVPVGTPNATANSPNVVSFKYALSASDTLLIYSQENSFAAYATGFSVIRNERVLRRISLRDSPEMPHDDPAYANSFTALAVTRACGTQSPIFFVTLQYQGDVTSPALAFVLVPSPKGYLISPLPMFSGGILEVPKANPFHFKVWDNLHEGGCEACPTSYEVTDYGIRDGKPVRIRKHKTRQQYNSGDFDGRRRIRFIK